MYEHLHDKDREVWDHAFRTSREAEEKLLKLIVACDNEQQLRYVLQDIFTVTRYSARHDAALKLGEV